jgi:hypothetical protein
MIAGNGSKDWPNPSAQMRAMQNGDFGHFCVGDKLEKFDFEGSSRSAHTLSISFARPQNLSSNSMAPIMVPYPQSMKMPSEQGGSKSVATPCCGFGMENFSVTNLLSWNG